MRGPRVVPVTVPDALRVVLPALRCPVCEATVDLAGSSVRCEQGHTFDVARQGYLGMLTGRGTKTGDIAAMVAARVDVFAAGLLDPVVAAVADATGADGGLVLDLAGGSGHYLAAVLDRFESAHGICIDASAPALRRAARAHPRAAALGADVWARLPLAPDSVSRVLSVFGPRNASELDRVLVPDGRIVVAAPAPEHLGELIGPLGLVRVDPHKSARQAETFAGFTAVSVDQVRYSVPLDHAAIDAIVGMGPSAVHLSAAVLGGRVRGLPETVMTTVAVDVTTYVR